MTFYVRLTIEYVQDGEDGDGQPIQVWKVFATPISEETAASTRGFLRVDVSSMSYVASEYLWNEIIFHGPRPPVPEEYLGEYTDPDSSGVVTVSTQSWVGVEDSFPGESIALGINFYDWPADYPRGAFIVEYEAAAEMLYVNQDFDGRPSLWMWANGDEVRLNFRSSVPTGLGLTSFKVYTLGDGAPAEPFWADLVNCTELA